jgi:hypothetical protein
MLTGVGCSNFGSMVQVLSICTVYGSLEGVSFRVAYNGRAVRMGKYSVRTIINDLPVGPGSTRINITPLRD